MSDLSLSGPALLADGSIAEATIWVRSGTIARVTVGAQPSADLLVDGLIAPGLIDLQLNGAWGYDFTTDGGTVAEVAEHLPATGVTAFLPTIITSPFERYPRRLAEIAAVWREARGAQVLGVHLEGPYLSPLRAGAHDPALLRPVDLAEIARWAGHPLVKLVTLAPELPGAPDAARRLAGQGVIVSAGHSEATFEEANAAFAAGVTCGTHLFNAMREMRHREPGLAGALLNAPIASGLIADGVHVHPAMARLAYQAKGSPWLALVSDAMAAMGMPPGRYHLGGRDVLVDAISARLAGGTLAGSILTMDQAVRNMLAFTGCSLAQALTMATATPARVLGLRSKGALSAGYDADVIVLDAALRVTHTLVCGQMVFEERAGPRAA
jgi:N-acetylglucosamine-6-phosphate deacetylase